MHDHSAAIRQRGAEDEVLIPEFAGRTSGYYVARFARIQRGDMGSGGFNVAATLGGPVWAAARGLWWVFWLALSLDLLALILLVNGTVPDTARIAIAPWGLWGGAVLLIVSRISLGYLSNGALYRHYNRWRADRRLNSGVSLRRSVWGLWLMLCVLPLVVYRTTRVAPSARDCRNIWERLGEGTEPAQELFDCLLIGVVPTDLAIFTQVAQWINAFIGYCTVNFQNFFDAVAWTIRFVLTSIEALFVGIPWPVTALVFVLLAWRTAGRAVAIFVGLSLLYLGLFNFWANAMSTLSLVFAAVFICVVVGVPIGIWCAKSARAYRVVRPVLDVMQTLPAFVYLIPAIAFFSIGKTPGVIATFIFSSPAVIRLTALGIQQVPYPVKEAALAFGASPLQLLCKVELPLALSSIMTGINQTIMLAISMSVTAALIGAGGLGFDVLFALQNVEPGRGVLAGLAIALCAMMIDRIIQGRRRLHPE